MGRTVSGPVLKAGESARRERAAGPGPQVVPSLARERALWAEGHQIVVGVDEVGRGSWAGPISVGAAVLPANRRVYGVRDSKMLTESERERLFPRLTSWCTAWAVGHASQQECDDLGMSAAQKLAARRAVDGLGVMPDAILIDGLWDFVTSSGVYSGKVTRDRIMRAEAEHFPAFDFELNKGYPCPRHKAALAAWGPTSIHRRAWVFMDNQPWNGVQRLVRDLQPTLW